MSKMMNKISLFGFILIGGCFMLTTACRNGELISAGLSAEERYSILREHNDLRQQVAMGQISGQPGAANMQEMVWDDELARRAQSWASQCIYEHDPNRFDDRFSIGQNLAIIWSSAPLEVGDFPGRVRKWFNEVNIYRWGQGWTVRTGHYSQMIWAQTNLVGCGFSYYRKDGRYSKLYVCNYGPAGNVAGRLPYQPGYPQCDGYGMQTSKQFPGLCRVDDYENSINGVQTPYVYSPYDPRYSRPGPSSVSNHNQYYNNKNQLETKTSRPSTSTYRQNIGYQSGNGRSLNQVNQPEVRYVTFRNNENRSLPTAPLDNINKAIAGYRWDLLFKDLLREIV
jgi:hypothetical protein